MRAGTASALVICALMPLRIWVIGTRTSSAPAGNSIAGEGGAGTEARGVECWLGAGAEDAAGAAVPAAGVAPWAPTGFPVRTASTWSMTSSRVIRPPPPVPTIWAAVRPCSRSSRRTAGVIRASGLPGRSSAAAGWAGVEAAIGTAAGSATGRSSEPAGPCADSRHSGPKPAPVRRGAASSATPSRRSRVRAAAAGSPSAVSMTAISALLGTVAPSSTRISVSVPSNGDGTSALTLSVMTSRSGSYLAT